MTKNSQNHILTALAFSLALGLALPISALAASPAAVNLGSAGNYVILSKTGISTTGATAITGDLGLSPAAATYITGFALTLPSASPFSTSALVTGKIYSPSYADPSSANLTTAVLDMQNAYTDAAGRAPNVTELGGGNIGGLTLTPGVYKWGTGLLIPTDVTFSGSANDVWIFQIAQNLSLSSGTKIILAGGAQAANIYWQVAGQTTLGTTSVFNGNILDQTAVVLNTGAHLNGRALAQTAVTLDSNAVVMPVSVSGSVTPAPTPTPTPTPIVVTPAPVVSPTICEYPAPPQGCSYVNSSNYNSVTNCGLVLSCTSSFLYQPVVVDANVAVLQKQLIGLLATFKSLQAQAVERGLVAPGTMNSPTSASQRFGQSLTLGSRGGDVTALQLFLATKNVGPAARNLAQHATGYFGTLTRNAVVEFQQNAGIAPASGFFGIKTRSYVNSLNQ